MSPIIKITIACLAMSAAAACAQEKPAPLGPPVANDLSAPALTAAQIRSVVVGNTASGPMSGSHVMFTMYVAPDGTALIDLPTGVEAGAWHVTDDGQWCARWQNYLAGQESCQRVFPDGGSYKFVNATQEELLTFTPGKHIAG